MSKTFTRLLAILLALCFAGAWAGIDRGEVAMLDSSALPGFSLASLYSTREQTFYLREKYASISGGLDFVTVKNLVRHEEVWANKDRSTFNSLANSGGLRGSDALRFAVTRLRLGSPQQAVRFAEYFNALGQGGWTAGSPSGTVIGDKCWYWVSRPGSENAPPEELERRNRDSLSLRVVKGSFKIDFVANGYWDGVTGKPFDRALAERVAATYVNRLRPDQDLQDGADSFALTVNILSKHVKPHKGETARILITSGHYPVRYDVVITRQGETVYEANFTDTPQTGPFEFTWDGMTSGGQRAANGSHQVTILASDASFGTATQEVQVEVNFQGGK